MKPFGTLPDGRTAHLFNLGNRNGIQVNVTNYGGIITHILTPDRNGRFADIALGFDNLERYLQGHPYFGAIIGRVGNRIRYGRFSLEGELYQLNLNNGVGLPDWCLHGGLEGFDKKLWKPTPLVEDSRVGLRLQYTSPDGEEHFPGTLDCTVTYWLDDNDTLAIHYTATTDKATHINLTNHSYFNLKGEGSGDILDHVAEIHADAFTEIDEQQFTTGRFLPTAGTPLDFSTPHTIGERIEEPFEQLRFTGGYDHCYRIRSGLEHLAASVWHPENGRCIEVRTTEPGLQFYTGSNLDGGETGKAGNTYHAFNGFCLETQHFSDTPNRPEFPSTLLRPGERFQSTTTFRFCTRP